MKRVKEFLWDNRDVELIIFALGSILFVAIGSKLSAIGWLAILIVLLIFNAYGKALFGAQSDIAVISLKGSEKVTGDDREPLLLELRGPRGPKHRVGYIVWFGDTDADAFVVGLGPDDVDFVVDNAVGIKAAQLGGKIDKDIPRL